jgi:hypothetical protein
MVRAREGIASEALLHLQGQAAHAAPHVRVPRRDPYPNAGRNWDHGLTDRSTADTSPGDAPARIRTIARSNSTVIGDPIIGTGSACTRPTLRLSQPAANQDRVQKHEARLPVTAP